MRRLACYLALALMLVGCGSESGRFRIEGRFRNMNQGEFMIFSPDGGVDGIDTIRVANGRFAYETELYHPSTFIIVFPNFSEQAVFGESGSTVSIKGDATHLREMTIKGTKENVLMTRFREETNSLPPAEMKRAVTDFVRQNPGTLAAIYLTNRFLIRSEQPDYALAAKLVKDMLKENPENGQLLLMDKELVSLKNYREKGRLPDFSATDLDGRRVSRSTNLQAKVNVVTVWATWSYPSTDIQRRLNRLKKANAADLSVVSICIDGDPKRCRRDLAHDSLKWSTVCDGQMWQSPLLRQLGISYVPANYIVDKDGRIIDRDLNPQELENKIKELLKK